MSKRNSVVILALIVLIVYGQTLWFDFVSLDNIHLTNISYLDQPLYFWKQPYALYTPVTYSVWSMLSAISSSIPFNSLCHGASVAIHGINVWLVLSILRSWFDEVPALFGSILFAIHPLQVESVAWASELGGLLATAFGLIALKGSFAGKSVWLTTMCFTLALLSKPSAAAFLPIAVILNWPGRLTLNRKWLFNHKLELIDIADRLCWWIIPLIILACINISNQSYQLDIPFWHGPLVMLQGLGLYLTILAIPLSLSPFYELIPTNILDTASLPYFIMISFGVFLHAIKSDRERIITKGLVIFCAGLLPVLVLTSFMFHQWSVIADRHVYISMFGAAWIYAYLYPRHPLFKTLTLFWLFISVLQIQYWKNDITLWTRVSHIRPNDSVVFNNLGAAYIRYGKPGDAIDPLRRAKVLNDKSAEVAFNLGLAYMGINIDDNALEYLSEAIRKQPRYPRAYLNRGLIYARTGDEGKAIRDFSQVIRIDPLNWDAYNHRALAYFNQGEIELAKQDVRVLASAKFPLLPQLRKYVEGSIVNP